MKKEEPPFHFVFALFTTLFLAIFYNTVTNMAGIYIASELGGSSEISVYPMVFFGLGTIFSIPLTHPLAARIGPLRLLIYALGIYTAFSILCATAPTFFLFNCYRLGLGFGAGFFFILCSRLIMAHIAQEKEATYSLAILIMFAVVPVLGVSFGAWVSYESNWRWIFHVNEPISLFLMLYFYLQKEDPPLDLVTPFDLSGYLSFSIGVGALLTAVTMGQQLDWMRSDLWLLLMGLGISSFLFWFCSAWITPHPILDLTLFRNSLFAIALTHLAILFSSYFGMIILITLWLNIYANYTPTWIAVLVGVMAISGSFVFALRKIFFGKLDPRHTLVVAILCFAISCYYSTYFDIEIDFFHLAVARSLAGMGLILFLIPVFTLSFASHGAEKKPAILTLFQVTRALFSSLGAGAYVILWQRRQVFFHERLGEKISLDEPLTTQYFQRATEVFHLTKERSAAELSILLEKQATSLALNDVFGLMGAILMGLLALLIFSFFTHKRVQSQEE